MKNKNTTAGQVSPAMKIVADNWNRFAEQFAKRFQGQLNEIKVVQESSTEKCPGQKTIL